MFTFTKNNDLGFVLDKAKEIGYAMFKADIASELQIPNNVISTLKTEEDGSIWFFTSRKSRFISTIDGEFSASLDYYKKGSDFRLHIDGKATVVDTKHNLPDNVDTVFSNLLLVKLTIVHAEYFENKRIASTSLREKITYFLNDLFVHHSYRSFDFPQTA